MSRLESFFTQRSGRPSVYVMTDQQLADEYSALTGALVQVPSSRNAAAWWAWRSELQEKLEKARSSKRVQVLRA